MNQFIIENPVLSIVIAYIIGAVIMHITSAITIRMAVEKEVEKAMGEDYDNSYKLPILDVWLGIDGNGCRCFYLAPPVKWEKGTGPLFDYSCDYYYHASMQFVADDFDPVKLKCFGIELKPEGQYDPLSLYHYQLKGIDTYNFLNMVFNEN